MLNIYIYMIIYVYMLNFHEFPIDITIHLLTVPFSAKHSFIFCFNPVVNPNKTWAPHLWPKSCCTLQSNEKTWLTPSQGTPILSIWSFCTNLWWILVQKHPSVLGETPHIPVVSHQPVTPSNFWGCFRYTKLDGTTILLHVVIHVRPQNLL